MRYIDIRRWIEFGSPRWRFTITTKQGGGLIFLTKAIAFQGVCWAAPIVGTISIMGFKQDTQDIYSPIQFLPCYSSSTASHLCIENSSFPSNSEHRRGIVQPIDISKIEALQLEMRKISKPKDGYALVICLEMDIVLLQISNVLPIFRDCFGAAAQKPNVYTINQAANYARIYSSY